MSCGCTRDYTPEQLIAAKATMCAVCRTPERGSGGVQMCGAVPVEVRVLGARARPEAFAIAKEHTGVLWPGAFFCPRDRHPMRETIGGESVRIVRWLGLRWIGVPWPVRLWMLVRSARHPRPGRVPLVSAAAGRVVLVLQRRGLWPRRLWWMRRIASSHPRLLGCGCVVVLKRAMDRFGDWAGERMRRRG
ncbi:MAG: hypothetical protein AAF235_05455 [Planctomycetota bacterium]